MNQQKIEPDFKQMASTINEVVSVVKQESLLPVVKIFMESVESHGYTEPEILNGIVEYFHVKDSDKYNSLIVQLEKSIKEARKINGEKVLFD